MSLGLRCSFWLYFPLGCLEILCWYLCKKENRKIGPHIFAYSSGCEYHSKSWIGSNESWNYGDVDCGIDFVARTFLSRFIDRNIYSLSMSPNGDNGGDSEIFLRPFKGALAALLWAAALWLRKTGLGDEGMGVGMVMMR